MKPRSTSCTPGYPKYKALNHALARRTGLWSRREGVWDRYLVGLVPAQPGRYPGQTSMQRLPKGLLNQPPAPQHAKSPAKQTGLRLPPGPTLAEFLLALSRLHGVAAPPESLQLINQAKPNPMVGWPHRCTQEPARAHTMSFKL